MNSTNLTNDLDRSNFKDLNEIKDYLNQSYNHQCWMNKIEGRPSDKDYLEEYQRIIMNRSQSFKPQQNYEYKNDPLQMSEYKAQYLEKELQQPNQMKNSNQNNFNNINNQMNDAPFNSDTEYNKSYQYKDLPRDTTNFAPKYVYDGGQKFDHNSTYKTNYVPHDVKYVNSKVKHEYIPNNEKFDGKSMYKQEYQQWDIPQQKSCKPVQQLQEKCDCSDWNSTYKQNFDGKQPEFNNTFKQQSKCCPLCYKVLGCY